VADAGGPLPSRDELTLAWADQILPALGPKARARFRAGRFVEPNDATKVAFALPSDVHRSRCLELRPEVEEVLGRHFGRAVPLELVVESEVSAVTGPGPDIPLVPAEDEENIDPAELMDAPAAGVTSPIDHVMQVFDGAVVVEE
jgi:hypothetical protein